MTSESKAFLALLKANYDEVASNSQTNRFGARLNVRNEDGYVYGRFMQLTGRFCIANIELEEHIQGQGILTSFVEYICENPGNFTGVEVELIHNPRLAEALLKRGWQVHKPLGVSEEASRKAPTLYLSFAGDEGEGRG